MSAARSDCVLCVAIVAKLVAEIPFTPGHEMVGEVGMLGRWRLTVMSPPFTVSHAHMHM